MYKLMFIFLFFLTFNAQACLVFCNDEVRTVDHDTLKVDKYLKSSGYTVSTKDPTVYCKRQDMAKDRYLNIVKVEYIHNLLINTARYKKGYDSDSNWVFDGGPVFTYFGLMKALNFGLKGMTKGVSDDKHCVAVELTLTGTNIFYCAYDDYPDLDVASRGYRSLSSSLCE